MTGKFIFMLILAAFISSFAYAGDIMSAGFGGNFTSAHDKYNYDKYHFISRGIIGSGFYAFFDVTFAEASIGVKFTNGIGNNLSYLFEKGSYLSIGLNGKFPINFRRISLFPVLGIQYDIGLDGKHGLSAQQRADFMNRFWVKFGTGADFYLKQRMYIRASLLYGIYSNSKRRSFINKPVDITYMNSFHQELDVRAAIGFRF